MAGLQAVAAGEYALDGLFLHVEELDDGSGVILSGCGEDVDLVVFAHLLQELQAVGPDIELECVLALHEHDI